MIDAGGRLQPWLERGVEEARTRATYAGLRERFSDNAKEARERFSIERVTGMWEDLFEKAAK